MSAPTGEAYLRGPMSPHHGLLEPRRKPPRCLTGVEEAAEGVPGLPRCWGRARPAASPHTWLCRAQPGRGRRPCGLYSRAVPIHLDGVDTVLGPAPALQEGTVVLKLQAPASEVAALEDLHAEILPMLRAPRERRKERRQRALSPIPPPTQNPRGQKVRIAPGLGVPDAGGGGGECHPNLSGPPSTVLVLRHEIWLDERGRSLEKASGPLNQSNLLSPQLKNPSVGAGQTAGGHSGRALTRAWAAGFPSGACTGGRRPQPHQRIPLPFIPTLGPQATGKPLKDNILQTVTEPFSKPRSQKSKTNNRDLICWNPSWLTGMTL